MTFGCFDSRECISQDHVISALLEVIRMEGDTLLGFPYLIAKCYLAEKVSGLGLFGFTDLSGGGVDSAIVQDAIVLIRAGGFARVREEGFATCMDVRDFRGVHLREHIDIHDEQVVHLYITPVMGDPEFQEWQRAIARLNDHPHSKNWHTLSIATHLHNRLCLLSSGSEDRHLSSPDVSFDARKQTVLAYIKKRAQVNQTSLPEGVFRDAFSLLDGIGLSVTGTL